MDTEEGVEVVWNEVQFSEKKNFRAQQVCTKYNRLCMSSKILWRPEGQCILTVCLPTHSALSRWVSVHDQSYIRASHTPMLLWKCYPRRELQWWADKQNERHKGILDFPYSKWKRNVSKELNMNICLSDHQFIEEGRQLLAFNFTLLCVLVFMPWLLTIHIFNNVHKYPQLHRPPSTPNPPDPHSHTPGHLHPAFSNSFSSKGFFFFPGWGGGGVISITAGFIKPSKK